MKIIMITNVDEDGNLTIPPELLEKLDWKEGDVLELIDHKDGTFQLSKPKNNGIITNSN